MNLADFFLPVFIAVEVFLILLLYRYVLRDWIIEKWEEKMTEEGWLVLRLEPVIDEIEDRMHDKLEQFQSSFFGSVGAMTKKAKNMDPMNNLRKAVKDGDWGSMLLEYTANKANLGGLLANKGISEAVNKGKTGNSKGLDSQIPKKIKDFLHK
tara:strand:+ start:482 stop:940 length:459 start_codon:yes stop_codon:yes gene_type:complete